MVLILLHWKRRQSVVRKLNTVVSQLNAPGVYLTFGVVDPAFLTLLAEVFYLAPSFSWYFYGCPYHCCFLPPREKPLP